MFTTVRLCYYKGLKVGDRVTSGVQEVGSAVRGGIASVGKTWKDSPSIFQPSPLDAIAEQRLFEIERNFLKLNGFDYPPLRPASPPPGFIRVEYYAEMGRMYQGKWDCWADIPLLPTGELDIEYVKQSFFLDPNHFVMIDPVRWKGFPLSERGRLSPIAIHNTTYGNKIPLRFVEPNLPRLTKLKRMTRAQVLLLLCMFNATFDLLYHLRAYDEYQFAVPLPSFFLAVYNFVRTIHPKTRRIYSEPDMDVISTPIERYSMPIEEVYQHAKLTQLLSSPTKSQIWYASMIQIALIMWVVTAEVIACTHASSA